MRALSRLTAGVPSTVVALGVVSLLMDVSSEMLVPVMPLFVTGTLGASALALGLIEGSAESLASLLKYASGRLSDRGSRKPWALSGYGLSALARPLIALAGSWPALLGARLVDRTGKGLRTAPRDAMIAAATPPDRLGRAFGLHRAMDTTGAVIGPLIAYLTLPALGFRGVFWLAVIPAVLAVVVLALAVREPPAERQRHGARAGSLPRDPRLSAFLAAVGLFALGNSSDAFLLLRTQDLGVPVALVPLAYLGFNLVYALAATPAGVVADALGRGRVARWGLALFALVYLGFARATAPWHAWLLLAAYGLFMAFTEGVWKSYLGELAPAHSRGAAFGAFNAVIGLAALPASLVAGRLWDTAGHAAPFHYGAAMAAAALVLLLLATPRPAGTASATV